MKKRLLVVMLTICIVFGMTAVVLPVISQDVSAATAQKGTAGALIQEAFKYKGKSLSQTKSAMKANHGKNSLYEPNYRSEWCAWFVSNCAKYTGLSDAISAGTVVKDVATGTVNKKKGRIVFTDYNYYIHCKGSYNSDRTSYKKNYKPSKGDLVLFYNNNPSTWNPSHIGIVTNAKSSSHVSTIEGNTGVSIVDYYPNRGDYSRGYKVAYVTPKYGDACSHKSTNKQTGNVRNVEWSISTMINHRRQQQHHMEINVFIK